MIEMKKFIRYNGLSLAFFFLFVLALAGQFFAGFKEHNKERVEQGQPLLTPGEYFQSGHFTQATFENWESEFLQMASYVLLTVWLVQKGSSESKPLGGDPEKEADPRMVIDPERAPGPVRRGGWRLVLYENSLGIALVLLFMLSFLLHALGGAREYSAEQVAHGQQPVSAMHFVTTSTFWFQSFQNWQSEFVAVGSIVVLTIFLRQRGSPESKPVAAPHHETGG